jgi:drug/metabolite transporter (DMT)-like permease
MFPAFLTTLLFSISAVTANRSIRFLGSSTANLSRLLVAFALLAAYAHWLGQGLSGPGVWYFFISGCIGFGFGDIALFLALPRLGSRLTILLTQCLAAPIAGVVEWSWLGTRLSAWEMILGAVTLAGVALALLPGRQTRAAGGTLAAGLAFGIAAAFGQGLGAVFSRKAYAVTEMAGLHIDGSTAAYQRIIGGILITALAWAIFRPKASAVTPASPMEPAEQAGSARKPGQNRWRRAWPWVVANAMAGPVIGVSCFQWALGTTPSAIVLPIVALTPIVVMPFAYFFEGDRPKLASLAGAAIAVGAAAALAVVG